MKEIASSTVKRPRAAKGEESAVRPSSASGKYKRAPVRLWVKACFLGFRRNRENQRPNQVLLKIQGVNENKGAQYYFGKRVVYIYKAQSKVANTRFRTIWGRIARCHGSKGVVIARFSPNLPSRAIGSTLRVMLYPQRGA